MFNLEQAIADWRQKMLAAGIETPVPLEELELHLREEVERQVSKGMDANRAFDEATKSIGEAQSLKIEFKKVPEKFRDKFFRVAGSLVYICLAWGMYTQGHAHLSLVNFKFAYESGSFSYIDLLIGPIFNSILGFGSLLAIPVWILYAWYFFRKYPNLRVQKSRSANFKEQTRSARRMLQVFCAMFVGWMGWLFCLHAVWQIDDIDFSFAFIGGSFSLENLFIGPIANLIMGMGGLALGGWLIGCAWKTFSSSKAQQDATLSHV